MPGAPSYVGVTDTYRRGMVGNIPGPSVCAVSANDYVSLHLDACCGGGEVVESSICSASRRRAAMGRSWVSGDGGCRGHVRDDVDCVRFCAPRVRRQMSRATCLVSDGGDSVVGDLSGV
jgi:hypothetical protein